MRSIPILIMALIIAVVVPHACAGNVTYPQEYYDLNKQADDLWVTPNMFNNYNAFQVVLWKLNSIQIALEKQNELINDQNDLLRKLMNQTYSVHYSYISEDKRSSLGAYTAIPNL